jgi:Uma2 family endonuclease
LENGEIVEMPSPSELHGIVCAWIVHLLWKYVIQRGCGRVCSNDTGFVVKRQPDTVRGPDIMVFETSLSPDRLSRSFADETPSLIVEVFSPSDRMGKVNKRAQQFLRRGVETVWVVEPDDRIVTVYRSGQEPQSLDEADQLIAPESWHDFNHKVAELFAFPGQQTS